MPSAWAAFDTVAQPRNYDWAHAQCLGCRRRWTWHYRAKTWSHPARKYSIYRMLCPACLAPLTRVGPTAKSRTRYRVIPHALVRMYLKSWPAERP